MKKPIKPGLLATKKDVGQYQKDLNIYKSYLATLIHEESGLSSPQDLVMYLVEKYHPKYSIKQKVGAKTKWSDLLNCVIAVEIAALRAEFDTRQSTIDYIAATLPWKRLTKDSRDPYGLINKAATTGKKSKFFKIVQKARLHAVATGTLSQYQKDNDDLIREALKKN
jgi:hypothetical protein